jgi:hypothetical protein
MHTVYKQDFAKTKCGSGNEQNGSMDISVASGVKV